jgi:hypothetical protein
MKTKMDNKHSTLHRLLAVAALTLPLAAVTLHVRGQSAQSPYANPDPANLRTFIELARSDLKTEKAVVLAHNLPLTEAEGAEFWPLQREYENELTRLGDERLAIVQEYAAHYDEMGDNDAKRLVKKQLELDHKKIDLQSNYFKKFSKVIPAKKAARFFQIERQINSAVDLRVAASLPLVK